jgi:hypothetical protein
VCEGALVFVLLSSTVPFENSRAGIGIDISPMPAASWPNACATFAPCRKANRSSARDAAAVRPWFVGDEVTRLILFPVAGFQLETPHVVSYITNKRIIRRSLEKLRHLKSG